MQKGPEREQVGLFQREKAGNTGQVSGRRTKHGDKFRDIGQAEEIAFGDHAKKYGLFSMNEEKHWRILSM